MDITAIEHGAVTVLALNGSLDATTADEVDQELSAQFGDGRFQIAIDMSGVEFLSSAGLRTLLGALGTAREGGGDVRLAAGSPNIKRVLDLSGFTRIMSYYESAAEAAASFSQ